MIPQRSLLSLETLRLAQRLKIKENCGEYVQVCNTYLGKQLGSIEARLNGLLAETLAETLARIEGRGLRGDGRGSGLRTEGRQARIVRRRMRSVEDGGSRRHASRQPSASKGVVMTVEDPGTWNMEILGPATLANLLTE